MQKNFSINSMKNIRRRYYHVLTGTDVLKIGTLCLKHMRDPTPPNFKWASGSVPIREKDGTDKARFENYYTPKGLEFFSLFSTEPKFHGVQCNYFAIK